MATTLDELLEKYLTDERYLGADPAEMKARVTQMYVKHDGLKEDRKLFMIDSVVEAKFGVPPKETSEPQDSNSSNSQIDRGFCKCDNLGQEREVCARATTLDELLEKYLNDERYPDADPGEMRAQVTRLFKKFDGVNESSKVSIIETRIKALFGKRPSGKYEPQDLNIKNTLKDKGIL